MSCPNQPTLDAIFPPDRADAFFDALYGGAEEGAYDIRLVCQQISTDEAHLAFQLDRRAGKCLKCSLTYGLPEVFKRHPIIGVAKVAEAVAEKLGMGANINWQLGNTQEVSEDRHIIPFTISKS